MEKLLEQALQNIKNGQTLDRVVLNAPENQRAELKTLLSTSLLLSKIPKNIAPAPALKRKYILAPIKQTFWYSILHISRFAATSTAAVLLFVVFALGGYAAYNSLPGQTLFSVKRTAENVRLKFVMSEAAKAQLQLDYAQNRYNEALTILNNPQSKPEQEVAALNELSSQTKTATQSVQDATLNQPLNENSHPLVSKLENLAKQQSALIKTAKNSDQQVKLAASGAAQASQDAGQQAGQIKKYLTIAESSQDPVALVDLSSDPDAVTISGVISKTDKNTITVEKLSFTLTEKTEIKDLNGQILKPSDLKTDVKIKVVAKKQDDKLFAQKVISLQNILPSNSEVKGAATTTPSTSTPPSTQTTTPSAAKTDQTANTQEKPQLGSVIIESPNPQYTP